MIAELISVGTELLLGDILNTNVQFLSKLCAMYGVDVYHTSVVGDNYERLEAEVRTALSRSDLVLLSGGLGSTADDITKRVVLKIVNRPTVVDRETEAGVIQWFQTEQARKENRIVTEFPEGSIVFPNHHGTAGGAWIPLGKKAIVLFPGPPDELEPMARKSFQPILAKQSGTVTKSLFCKIGILGEYAVNRTLGEALLHHENPTFAPYVKPDGALVRITAKADNEAKADSLLQAGADKLRARFGPLLLTTREEPKEELLVQLLRARDETVSVAESLTGGMVSSKLVNVPGSSHVLHEAYVLYADAAKRDMLGVSEQLLRDRTAVSEEVCRAMAEGLGRKTGASLCLATTGYAGPEGEAVGDFYIGVRYAGQTIVRKYHAGGGRAFIRRRAATIAIDLAILVLRGAMPA